MSHSLSDKSTNCVFDLIKEVAERESVEATKLPPLYESINPEALTDIVNAGNEDLRVIFSYQGYQVTINGTSSIHLLDTE